MLEETESVAPGLPSQEPDHRVHYEPRVRMVLLVQLGLFILGSGIGAVVFNAMVLAFGWDSSLAINENSPEMDRWQIRLQLGLGHLFAFCGSGAFTVWAFYRSLTGIKPDWPDYLKTRRAPGITLIGLTVLLMAVSIPLVLYSLNINKLIPLPDFFKELEAQTESVLKGLLRMDHLGEFLGNLTIIALLPALGEELVFRGIIQRQLMRRISNPFLAILLASAIFSLAHFQLEGFIPRMLLGIILGWLYWETQNFWVPVIGHFFNNGIQVLGQYLYGKQVSSIDLEKDVQVPWEFAAISVFMIWVTVRLIRNQNKTQNQIES
ncbi:MAG: CPBP family intramembrane metalloprotease [Saprospiraceae bacterium]|nr:CPBP family intramembrane metalloprotease [Saprospiraceae bacterium]